MKDASLLNRLERNFRHTSKAAFAFVLTTATYLLARTTGFLPLWLSGVTEDAVIPRDDGHEMASQRRLLQTGNGVTVVNPIPDQVIQVNQQYAYSLDNVFSGNYSVLGAVEMGKNNLPSWLSMQPQLLSIYPGSSCGVVLNGSTAFVASSELQIIDVSNLTHPRLLSTYPVSSYEISVSGNIAFVADYSRGLRILDVSNTSNPRLLSKLSFGYTQSYGLAMSGHTVFIANYINLQIIEVSNTSNPRLLSTVLAGPNSYVYGVAINGNTAFVAVGYNGLQIMDVSNTSNPQLLSTYYSGGFAFGVAISAGAAFVANEINLQILDISNISNPRLLSTFPSSTGGSAYRVVVSGSTVFVADRLAGLQIVDVSDLSKPRLLGSYPVGAGGESYGVAVSRSAIFVAVNNVGLQILDMSHASLVGVPPLSLLGQYSIITVSARNMSEELASDNFALTLDQLPRVIQSSVTDQSIYPGDSFTLLLNSELLFVNPSNSFLGLGVELTSGAAAPSWLNLRLHPLAFSLNNVIGVYPEAVVVNGNTVFLADSGLKILDVSSLSNPVLLSGFSASGSANEVAISGNTAFLAAQTNLMIFDVKNPSSPRSLFNFSMGPGGDAYSVAVSGSIVLVGDRGTNTLRILDVSNTTDVQSLATYAIGNAAFAIDVAISGNTAFLVYSVLQILDLSNPRDPQLISTYNINIGGGFFAVAVSGNTAFICTGIGLQILDVTNTSDPQLLSIFPSESGDMITVATNGLIALVAEGSGGVQILDVSNTSNPQLVSTYSALGGYALGVAISGNRAFEADTNVGLQILDLSQWQLTVTPGATHVGNYRLQISATDELGGSASTQPFTIRVEGSPRFNGNISIQYAKVGQAFNYFIPQGLVSDPNLDPISFSARLANNQSLPSWLSFSSISAAFVGTPQSSNVGNLTIVLSATDNIAGSANTSFILMTNNLPVVNQRLSNTFARVNQFFQLLIPNNTFSHPDGLALNYSAQLGSQAALPNWLRFNATSLFLSGQPNMTDAGSYDLRLIATDRYAGQASTGFTLSVGNGVQVNRLMNLQLAGVGLRYVFAVPSDSFINPDGTPFSLQTGTLPSWLTFATTTAQFTGMPLSGSRGTSLINVTATDLTGGTAMQSFNLTVTYFPQVVSPIVDQIAPIGRPYQFNVSSSTFIDQNGYALTYRAEQSNGQSLPVWLNFNATTLQFFGLPNITQALRYSLAVIATNPLGAEGRDEFSLFAEHYPTVQQPIPDAIAGVDQPLRLTISGSSFSDLDNDALRYNVTRADQSLLPNWLSFDAQALILSGTPLSAQLGNLTLLMTATDPSGGSAQQNFTIIVRYLPTLSQPVSPIAPVREGRLLNYTLPPGTFTDGNGATLYYNATQDSGAALPVWLNFNVFTQHFLGIPASSDVGTLAVRVIADDGQGGQASVSFSFTITPNYPPTLSKPVSNSVASVNQPFRLVLPPDTFTDANADPLNYTASQVDGSALPRWLAFDEKTITFFGTPGRSDTGDFSERIIPVRVTVRDDQSRASTQFNINVQGTSNIALFLQIATPIATIFTGVFAAYQKRALCFNRYKKQRYQRLDVEVKAGEMFEHKFGDMSMQGKKVLAKTPRQLEGWGRFFLSPRERVPGSGDMPSWMVYDLDTNSVRSVGPVPDDSPPELIIQVKDEAGVVHEQFTLRVTGLKAAYSEQLTTDVELAHTAAL